MVPPHYFFDLKGCSHHELFAAEEAVWTALDRLQGYLGAFYQKPWPLAGRTGLVDTPLVLYQNEVRDDLQVQTTSDKASFRVYRDGKEVEGASVILPGAYLFDDRIVIGSGTLVEPGALIKGPAVIGDHCEVRQGAYLRGDCLIGNGCVVGHTTEIKGSIMLDGSKAGHFAYIGDSILGREANLGAGTKLANLKMIPGSVTFKKDGKHYDTKRRKLGAILGDRTETGCNSVTSPGTLLGPRSVVYPALSVPGGYYPERTILMHSSSSLTIRTR